MPLIKLRLSKALVASQYGSDATGGVINIITRRGKGDFNGSVDLATGSWNKHSYNLTVQGTAGKNASTGYFVTATRTMSQDTKYKDGDTGEVATLTGSKWKEEGFNARIDHDFNKKQNLQFSVNYKKVMMDILFLHQAVNIGTKKIGVALSLMLL